MNHLSPNELQSIMAEYKAWVEKLGIDYLGGQNWKKPVLCLPLKTMKF